MTAPTQSSLEPIAIVGLAGRFPGARDLSQFWQNLVAGKESITFLSADELRRAGVPQAHIDNPDYVPAAPVMPEADRFDASLFGMTDREAEICDPQIRVFLEMCHSALENAGYDPFAMADSVGVFGATGPNSYLDFYLRRRPDLVGRAGMLLQTLNQIDYLSTLVAYKLDLRGPALTALTACSSTLVTVHLACQALRAGECDAALAGGAVVDLGRGHLWTPGNVLTSDGHCRPFDAEATGTIFGSGAGAVVLKRLDDALGAGDNIAAVILGSAVNNDGAEKVSFSAPSLTGQANAVMEAMLLADVAPDEVGYVEAHATGTALGDPVEVAALADAYRRLADGAPMATTVLGSVKSNIGHMGAVAGIAGLIKTVLMLQREAIPPTVNLATPNPVLELEKTPFELSTDLRPWPRDPSRRRVAGVTSLGIGGTNAHLLLTEGPPPLYEPPDGRPRVVAWSAGDEAGERRLRADLAGYFSASGAEVFGDATATLLHGRTAHRVRAAVVADSAASAAAALRDGSLVMVDTAVDEPAVAYLLPGQGTQRAGMARGIYGTVRSFSVAMDECIELFEDHGVPLYRRWAGSESGDESLADPMVAQPALFAIGYALATMWRKLGAAPTAVLGHSLGELTAAAVAGVFTLPDAVRLVVARAAAMAEHPVPGSMLVVAAGEDDVSDLVAEPLALSASNGTRQVCVSGPTEQLEELAVRLQSRKIISKVLRHAAAFHHPGWGPAADAWSEAFHDVLASPPQVPFYSAYAGRLADPDEVTRTEFWTGQLTRPVRFEAGLSALLLQHRYAVLLEVGSGTTLTGLARHSPHASSARTVATLGDGPGDRADVLTAAARLWLSGCPVNWSHAEMPPPAVRVPLPGYPYARDRHWADLPVETAPVQAGDVAPARVDAVPAPVEAPAAPVSTVRWVEGERTGDTSGRSGERALVILPAAPPAAIDVLLAVRRAGLQPVAVRPGDGYAEGGDGFRVRPGEQADLESVLARLADTGRVPDVLVHAATYGAEPDEPLDAQLKHGFYSLMALSRLVVTSNQWTVQPRLVLLTSHSVDVSGGERVLPARVALHGLFRTVAAESPRTACTAIDATGRVPVSELASEIAFGTTAPVVALRGNRRWLPTELPLPLPPATGRALRERGVYLIAGGTGGLGLEVARGLAATGLQPRLALLGRRGNDGVDEAELAALADCGAQVRVYPCDVTDLEGLRQTVEDVTSRFGPVAGVFHLAGVPGERMLAFREPADAKAVLDPKTAGTANLAAVFADRPAPDFTVYFSSRAAVEGLVGGADYAAANAFLDGVAVEGAASGALSIGWPVWRDAGMAATGDVDIATLHRAVRQLDSGQAAAPEAGPAVVVKREMGSATDWVLDEHRVGRMPLLPATAYIDLAVTAYREQVVRGAAPIELSDMVFHTPLLDRAPRTLRITFGPVDGRHDLRMESRPAGDGGAWTVHATGRIRAVEGTPERVDLASLRRRFTAAGAPGGRPRGQTKSRLLKLSPRWDNIADLLALPDERLLCIELPAPYRDEVAGHSLHPALLDTATAAGVRTPEQASSVPFHYQRLVVYGSLPARFHAHARRDTAAPAETPSGDIDLIDDDGTVLATITGFTMIMVDEQRLTASAKAASAPSRATQPAAAPARDGLPSDTGVDIMFRLLDAGVTGHVLVRPFVSGAPASLASVPAPRVREPALPPREPVPPARESAPAAQIAPAAPAPVAEGLEGRLLALWQQALGTTDIRPDQDFFESGGNSLSAIELMALIREEFGADLRVGLLLESRTFGDLCAALRDRGLE